FFLVGFEFVVVPIARVVRGVFLRCRRRRGHGRVAWQKTRDLTQDPQGGITDDTADRFADGVRDRAVQARGETFERQTEVIKSPRKHSAAWIKEIAYRRHDVPLEQK